MIHQNQIYQLSAIYLLERMVNKWNDIHKIGNISDLITWMVDNGLIKEGKKRYCVTGKGLDELNIFMRKYFDYINLYDVYFAIDLKNMKFAYDVYDQIDDDEWIKLLANDKWEDCRSAVARFKGLDPVEINFMGLLYDNSFGINDDDGKINRDNLLGTVWDEMIDDMSNEITAIDIVNKSIGMSNLILEGVRTLYRLHERSLGKSMDFNAIMDKVMHGIDNEDDLVFGEVVNARTDRNVIPLDDYRCTIDYFDPYFTPTYIGEAWRKN